jgi:hypothetical protein
VGKGVDDREVKRALGDMFFRYLFGANPPARHR